jgi:hypothetical protein
MRIHRRARVILPLKKDVGCPRTQQNGKISENLGAFMLLDDGH